MLNLKKVVSSSIIIGLLTSSYTLNALADNITVKLNNYPISFDVQPQIINGRTMVPLRAIFESLGATVEWDDANKSVNSKKDNTTVSMTVGNNTMWVNGVAKQLDVPPEIIDGRTLVPVRAIAESYNCTVDWDNNTQTVTIISNSYDNDKFQKLKNYIIIHGQYDDIENEYKMELPFNLSDGNSAIIQMVYCVNNKEAMLSVANAIPKSNMTMCFTLGLKESAIPLSVLNISMNNNEAYLEGYYDSYNGRFVETKVKYIKSNEEKSLLLEMNTGYLKIIDIILSSVIDATLKDFGVIY